MISRKNFLFGAVLLNTFQSSGREIKADYEMMVREDPRLRDSVTVAHGRILVGDLLDGISKLASIKIGCGDHDFVGSIPIAIFCKNRPIGEILEYLVSLLSFKGAPVVLEATGIDGNPPEYTVGLPPVSRLFFDRLRDDIRKDSITTLENLIKALDADDDTRKALERESPDVSLITDPRISAGIRGIARMTDADTRSRLFNGGLRIEGSLADAPDGIRTHARQESEIFQKNNPDFDPGSIDRYAIHVQSDASDIISPLFLTVSGIRGGFGQSVCGGHLLRNKWLKNLESRWVLDADTRVSPEEEASSKALSEWPKPKTVKAPVDLPPGVDYIYPGATVDVMEGFAVASGDPVLARLTDSPEYVKARNAKTVGEVVKAIRGTRLLVKKRKTAWLLLEPTIINQPYFDMIPLSVIRWVRTEIEAVRSSHEYLPFLHGVIRSLTPAQVLRLDREVGFPISSLILSFYPILKGVRGDSVLLAQLSSGQRVPVSSLPPAAQHYVRDVLGGPDIRGVGVKVGTTPFDNPFDSGVRIRLEILDRDNKPVKTDVYSWVENVKPKRDLPPEKLRTPRS